MVILATNTPHIRVVDARCQVHDENGTPVPLLENQVQDELLLPETMDGDDDVMVMVVDVKYNPKVDRLECYPNACRGWTVRNCAAVLCIGYQSCERAVLSDNRGVHCRGDAACQGALMTNTSTIVCHVAGNDEGLNANDELHQPFGPTVQFPPPPPSGNQQEQHDNPYHTNVCHGARLETTNQVVCLGPNACGSADLYGQDPTDVYLLGSQAVLRCGGGTMTTNHKPSSVSLPPQPSCSNLVVYIPHGRRACLAQGGDQHPDPHCAVICNNHHNDDNKNAISECDPNSIHFQVYDEKELLQQRNKQQQQQQEKWKQQQQQQQENNNGS
ncbi:hypothetical protein ACA910_018569 [Epithemia clementina (nom. ined.)]